MQNNYNHFLMITIIFRSGVRAAARHVTTKVDFRNSQNKTYFNSEIC